MGKVVYSAARRGGAVDDAWWGEHIQQHLLFQPVTPPPLLISTFSLLGSFTGVYNKEANTGELQDILRFQQLFPSHWKQVKWKIQIRVFFRAPSAEKLFRVLKETGQEVLRR